MRELSSDGVLSAAIPVISNTLILRFMESGDIKIDPFSAERLGPTSYQLCPHRLRFHTEDEDGIILADRVIRLRDEDHRELRPGEYAVVSPREQITLAEGFVADFYPSSWCVENRLVLTAGRLDSGYIGDLVFGVLNAGRFDVSITSQFQLARVTFGWLGSENKPVYTGAPPGAYIPELEQLRKREAELNSAADALKEQKEEVSRLRDELLRRASPVAE